MSSVTRIALAGATGSIGRQAIEIVEANPKLELVAATSGSTPIDGLAPLTQVGGDPTELLERAQPDVVLNAVVGFAGLPVTLWALEHGVTLALANKESLVAAGELALAAQRRGGGLLLPVDSEHSAIFQCLEGRKGEQVDSLVLTASGGPFRGRTRAELADVTPEQALAHPTWTMGPKITVDSATLANKGLELIEAHFLFAVPYERIEVVVHPTSTVHSLVRFRDGATLAHLGHPDMRVPISYALTYPERAATPVPRLDFAQGLELTFEPPDEESFPMLRLAREAGERGGTFPAVFNAANEVAVAAFLDGGLPFLGIAAVVEAALERADGARARDLAELTEADEQRARPRARGLRYRELVTTLVAIGGLAFLILVHEAGHFVTALAVRMRPRKFYLGFPPAIIRATRGGVEYGIGLIPLGGYVKIPGMFRPAPGDLGRWFGRAEEEAPALRRPIESLADALEQADFVAARSRLDELEAAAAEAELGVTARRDVERGIPELRDSLSGDAYWQAAPWKRIAVIFAGPGTNLLLAIVLFAGVFMVGSGAYRLGFSLQPNGANASAVVDSVLPGHPAERAGLQAGDRVLAIDGNRVTPNRISEVIGSSHGRPLTLTVQRDGRTVTLPPTSARKDTGESAPQAFGDSLRVTGEVTKEIALSLGRLVRGSGRNEISSPVGIVRGSEQAIEQGARQYLSVLGLISLSLALLNLLPLLPLDGGHIAFSIIEAVRGRAVARAVYERVSAVGIALVLLLFFVGLSNDLGGGVGG